MIHLDGPETRFELNDQDNTRTKRDIERLELEPTRLRIQFTVGRGPYSGRVSLSPQIEIFDRDTHRRKRLRSVLVEMKPTASQLTRIRQLLARHTLV